jgi:hypothetical protein
MEKTRQKIFFKLAKNCRKKAACTKKKRCHVFVRYGEKKVAVRVKCEQNEERIDGKKHKTRMEISFSSTKLLLIFHHRMNFKSYARIYGERIQGKKRYQLNDCSAKKTKWE